MDTIRPEHAPDGLLPEPNGIDTIRFIMRGLPPDRGRRLLLPCLASIGFHVASLSLLVLFTVTFADQTLGLPNGTTDDRPEFWGQTSDRDLREIDGPEVEAHRDYAVKEIDAAPVARAAIQETPETSVQAGEPPTYIAVMKGGQVVSGVRVAETRSHLNLTMTLRVGDCGEVMCVEHALAKADIRTIMVPLTPATKQAMEDGVALAGRYGAWRPASEAVVQPDDQQASERHEETLDGALSKDERFLFDLINKYRADHNVPLLLLSPKLCSHAQTLGTCLRDGGCFYGNDRFCVSYLGLTPQVAFDCYVGTGGFVSSIIRDKAFQYVGVSSGKGAEDRVYFAFVLAASRPKE
jgi:hypothetical protein